MMRENTYMNLNFCILPPAKIGIIGGGQLGKMMTQQAKKLGYTVYVLDPTPNSPAGQVADKQIVGTYSDAKKIRELVEQCAVTTYDLEHIDTTVITALAKEGHKICPSPELLAIIQDKLVQKEVFLKNEIPTPVFEPLEHPNITAFEKFGFPLVQKARLGGYDGRGVVVLNSKEDLQYALPVPSLIERFVEIDTELAVMVVRGKDGETQCYPVVEMVFDNRANILDLLLVPARISNEMTLKAKELAVKTVEVLNGVGIFGVEMLISKAGELFVNEVAPRPHNSGHYTIEACVTCQYEQHIRAITGLPLGSTDLAHPSVMINLLGEADAMGPPVIEGMKEAIAIPGVTVHIYGKKEAKPFRKMGHVTIVDKDLNQALEKALRVKKLLKIKGEMK